jgi:dolichol-phosphate mannosyltransferase
VCREMGVRHVRRNGGNAYGDAVRTMIAEARGDFLLNMDADGSHRAKDIAALWSLREEYGIVIGSRYVDGGGSRNPVRLRWMSWCLSATFRWVTGLAVQDFSNSLRLYRRELIVGLVLKAANFDVLQELLAQAVTAHPEMRIGEVPVMFARRVSGRSKRVGVVFLWSYAQMLWKLRRLRNADSPRE